MTGFAVEVRDLSVHYGDTRAVDHANLTIPAGSVTGLLGRNGSGKTTLLSAVASLRRPTSGEVLVDGQDPFENETLMERICLVRESGDLMPDERITTNLAYVASARPTWDDDLAGRLLDAFEIRPRSRPRQLSRGARSALGAVVGIASRAPLTLLDEVYLGMDAPSRYRFYDLLLEDYVAHPRTVVLSSHLINELERFLEHVVILHDGRELMVGSADELRGRGLTLTGPAARVDAAAAGLTVLSERHLGPTKQTTVLDRPDPARAAEITRSGVETGPVGLQDLFVHLTGRNS
ncbi:ABC transporter ATP-binding protein [Georgenia sp. SUBG003]|uniref:ABC transporter ATP-binding protein n=1 Tax=Georgenia sp. SUBG003 TaxID=1497974 RepID=UPI0004D5CA7C|nr:ABC transporter [Georgenia sp. SUBG003]